MKKLLLIIFLFPIASFAQSEDKFTKKTELGLEFQKYPVGFMPMLTANVFTKKDFALRFRIGANIADRKDNSNFNDYEEASGFGASFGVVKYLPNGNGNFIFGATLDTWNMWTNWKDNLNTAMPTQGKTYTLVIQPWINAGYLYNFSDKINGGLSLGFGREINVITNGERVGEGFMGIATVSINYKLN
ncbi:hypothetical protein [Flavobacterium sp.]|uniref:hypothetical protein n=1 Tax=Flavobacterium sp. TaxID=239 RepID=UPI00374FE0E6